MGQSIYGYKKIIFDNSNFLSADGLAMQGLEVAGKEKLIVRGYASTGHTIEEKFC